MELICRHLACPKTKSQVIYFTVHTFFFFFLVITCLQNHTLRNVSCSNFLCVLLCLFCYFSFQCGKYFYTVRELTSSGNSSVFRQRDQTLYLRCSRLAFSIRPEFIHILCLTEAEKSCNSFPYLCSFLFQHLFRSC